MQTATNTADNWRPLLEAVGFVILVTVVGSAPGVLSTPDSAWFQTLELPWFYPPTIAFPVVWTLLFTLLGIALWRVWRSEMGRTRRVALGAFVAQMVLNVAWTPAFFAFEQIGLAFVIIASLWVAIIGTLWAFQRVDRTAALLLVPYLLWVTFAAVLNAEIWRLNG